MYYQNFIYLIASFIIVVLPPIRTEDVCVKRSSCVCVFPNGTGIDLTPTASKPFYTAETYQEMQKGMHYRLSTYYYHPCNDFKLQINTSSTNSCNRELAMCRHVYNFNNVDAKSNMFNSSNSYEFLGESNKTYFSNDGRYIIYDNNPSNNTVLLICSQGESRLNIYSLDDPHELVLSFYSKDACLKQIEEAGRSLGSTLLVVFFSILIFYLVLGVCTKKFLMGATGIEVIPNLVFWMDLPNLVRDGWAFAINGFKLPPAWGPRVPPTPTATTAYNIRVRRVSPKVISFCWNSSRTI